MPGIWAGRRHGACRVCAIIPDFRTDTEWKLAYFALDQVISHALLFRTQNLAASAALHWMTNVHSALLVGRQDSAIGTQMVFALYSEPTPLAVGELPIYYGAPPLVFGLLVALLLWLRSPFYLPKAG
jgi:hypothetical protein